METTINTLLTVSELELLKSSLNRKILQLHKYLKEDISLTEKKHYEIEMKDAIHLEKKIELLLDEAYEYAHI